MLFEANHDEIPDDTSSSQMQNNQSLDGLSHQNDKVSLSIHNMHEKFYSLPIARVVALATLSGDGAYVHGVYGVIYVHVAYFYVSNDDEYVNDAPSHEQSFA
jgi:hypothetical protein